MSSSEKRKSRVIAVAGKGGSGKTAIAALLVNFLVAHTRKAVLAIDADPDANLAEMLGISAEKTLGDVREWMEREGKLTLHGGPGQDKKLALEAHVMEVIKELDDYDLLTMGRTEGHECYCYVNELIRGIIPEFTEDYDIIIMDTEAGLEHISRKIIDRVDTLLIPVNPTKASLNTAIRIRSLTRELGMEPDIYLVANMMTPISREKIGKFAKEDDFEIIGEIPYDASLERCYWEDRPLTELPMNSSAMTEINKIATKLNMDVEEMKKEDLDKYWDRVEELSGITIKGSFHLYIPGIDVSAILEELRKE